VLLLDSAISIDYTCPKVMVPADHDYRLQPVCVEAPSQVLSVSRALVVAVLHVTQGSLVLQADEVYSKAMPMRRIVGGHGSKCRGGRRADVRVSERSHIKPFLPPLH
jgi:hypothetical protein